ncbi:hypothetical protein AB0E01_32490 [Nocardia vinacea]|uniref:hypothetical protein n=1 Tax=Nocardia vinacea TaxID=96468 RepID=UPI0033FAF24A
MSSTEPSTLLGLIQRGRGACFVAALTQPAPARDLVVDCIIRDPRWDHQVEQCDWLYAALVAELGIEPARLRAAYAGPVDVGGDAEAWLATGVFAQLARRGIPGAVIELRHYLRSGRDLDQALAHVLPFAGHPEADGLLDDVLEVADDTQLTCALGWDHDLTASPWLQWRQASPRIERIVRAVARNRRPHGLSAPERRAERESAERECVLRAAIEARLISGPTEWEPTLLAIATDLLQAQDFPLPVRHATRRCLARLSSPRALAWARANADLDGDAGAAAISLIAEFAEPADGPRLCDLLKDALAQGNIYAQCDLVDGLARLGHVAAVGIIDEIFDGAVYSYLRTRCAAASALLSPDFAEHPAIECLDDCESETRALGVTHASDRMPMVRERIRGMAEDVTEEDCNRRTASARIAQWC